MTSFFGFAKRQNKLHSLEICGLNLFPCFLAALGLGHFCQLKELILPGKNIFLNCLSTLAGLIAEGALPMLAEFKMLKSQKKGAVATIMRGFQAGGCPLLTTLQLPICFCRPAPTLNAHGMEARVLDIDQTEQNMEALANALEVRAAAGTCQGLQKLYGDLLSFGRSELRTRLLWVLLPSIKVLPRFSPVGEYVDTMIVRDTGAPCLESLYLSQDLSPLIEALGSMARLRTLNIHRGFQHYYR